MLCSENLGEPVGKIKLLLQTYKRHERSREAIELAYDAILQQKMRVRHRMGFQPPQRGKKRDAQGDPLVSHLQLVTT